MAHFDADETSERSDVPEEHTFKLGGVMFRSKGALPPKFYENPGEYGNAGIGGLVRFLRLMVVPADRDAFEQVMSADDVYIEEADIARTANWLIGVLTERPTDGPGTSSTGPVTTSDT